MKIWEIIVKRFLLTMGKPGQTFWKKTDFGSLKASYKAILQNICSWGMVSQKIICVLMIFFLPGKSYVFLRNFQKALLEIFMCSSTFLVLNLMCSYKRIMFLLKFICFLITSKGGHKSGQHFGQHCSTTFVGQHVGPICYSCQHFGQEKKS